MPSQVKCSRIFAAFGCVAVLTFALCSSVLQAQTSTQNSIQLFGPVNVRYSADGTGYGAKAVNFNTSTLNLNCSAAPITAVLSSAPNGVGNLLVDNNIDLTVTSGQTTTGPTNICIGGVNGSLIGPFQNCFTSRYQDLASPGTLNGQNPDNYVAVGGVPPIDISTSLVPGPVQLKIDLVDEGFYLTNSTLYLTTNCTQGGVTGPALISGNPISSTNPTPDQLSQDFSFNPSTDQMIGFEFDLTEAQRAGSLSITDGTIPQVSDSPVDPTTFRSVLAPQTSFATSSCLIHSGELLPNGQPACKLYTLECKVGTGANATGAQCPVSTLRNEVFRDTFDGPAFSLTDIPTPGGPTFHQGIGFLMASEGWTGGPCTFDPASGLQNLSCPQNLLTSFTGPGLYSGTARTTHPNSTFISIAQVPEPLTTVTLMGANTGNRGIQWFKSDPMFGLSTQPPNLSGTTLPGAASFVPSPIVSLTYGISSQDTGIPPPVPGDTVPGDITLADSQGCPTPANPSNPPASAFTPDPQKITGLAEGTYLFHYFAQDCAGTEELQFTKDGTGAWSTAFYAVPFGVDRTPPMISTNFPPGSSTGVYQVGDFVPLQFTCTDALSGVKSCNNGGNGPGSTLGSYVVYLDTTSPGAKTLMLNATDNAGNSASASVQYSVVPSSRNSQVQLTVNTATITYPGTIVATVRVGPGQDGKRPPTGTVQILLDSQTSVGSRALASAGNGYATAAFFLPSLPAGRHTFTAVLSGVGNFNNGQAATSAPVSFTVLAAPVKTPVSCQKATLAYGADYTCLVFTLPIQAGATGVVNYRYDNGPVLTAPLAGGGANFRIATPTLGNHTVVVSYPAQGNFAAAPTQTMQFKVVPAGN